MTVGKGSKWWNLHLVKGNNPSNRVIAKSTSGSACGDKKGVICFAFEVFLRTVEGEAAMGYSLAPSTTGYG
uniref:Uncharacterized protein n=1 Tax=Peronospora matthiolae TaxID=2874970 RepID=A0AAV1TLZ7_9STRA